MRKLLHILLVLYLPHADAKTSDYMSIIDCEKSPQQCISFTNKALESVQTYSVQWYHLKYLNLSAHWQLSNTDLLREELPSLVELDNAPAVFRITALTIYSKLLLSDGNTKLGTALVDEVIQLIRDVNDVSLDPDRYAELIVLLNSVGEYQNAEQAGRDLLVMFKQVRRSIQLGDFYTALGHTQFLIGNYAAAKTHYNEALQSFIEVEHTLEVSNTFHNIARCYQAMKLFDPANSHFKQSLEWKAKLGPDADPRNEQYTRLRFVESLYHSGKQTVALNEFKKVRVEFVNSSLESLYNEIGKLVGYTAD